jgi:pyruvate dehydrogenase E2 component (dihydrolipoamide acetyltransferase)
VKGTGPDGRVVAEDVERASVQPSPAQLAVSAEAETAIPLSNIRRTIARRLTEAWQVPVFQLTVSADMTRANALLERTRELDPDRRVTVTDLLVRVCASALMRHPEVNVQFAGDSIHRFPSANVGFAVAAPQGLVVPVIHSAERLSLAEVAARRAEVVELARSNSLKLPDIEGGTFTISNLGMFGVEQFTAVLNPPQVAILAVGAVKEEPVVRDGDLDIAPILRLVLTCDHRAIDGADGAQFLQTLVALIEQPSLAL